MDNVVFNITQHRDSDIGGTYNIPQLSQQSSIENSHSQLETREQAMLKLYGNFFSHPPSALSGLWCTQAASVFLDGVPFHLREAIKFSG